MDKTVLIPYEEAIDIRRALDSAFASEPLDMYIVAKENLQRHIHTVRDINVNKCIELVVYIGTHDDDGEHVDVELLYREAKSALGIHEWDDFNIDDKVLVCNASNAPSWEPRYFAGIDEEGSPLAFTNGKTSWTSGNDTPTAWKYCKKGE